MFRKKGGMQMISIQRSLHSRQVNTLILRTKRFGYFKGLSGTSILILICFLSGLVFFSDAWSKTIYMGPSDSYKDLRSAFAAMSGGDTLIIRDGVYAGAYNKLDQYQIYPPSGSAGAYTKIYAENAGNVYFDGEEARSMMEVDGVTNGSWRYVEFKGINWIRPMPRTGAYERYHFIAGNGASDRTVHHIKMIRCGFHDRFEFSNASYCLVEDCFVVGRGRYNIQVRTTDHMVFRRVVTRFDNAAAAVTGYPIAHFVNYCSQDVEFQNCIAIDSDDAYYSNYEGIYGGFYVRNGPYNGYNSTNTKIRGSIVLNVKHVAGGSSSPAVSGYVIGAGGSGTEIINSVFWDMKNVSMRDNWGSAPVNYTINHCTFGSAAKTDSDSRGSFVDGGSNSYGDVSNSILMHSAKFGIYNGKSSKYNSFHGNTLGTRYSVGSTAGDITDIDPTATSLKYLVRIENGTVLKGAAGDGGDIGATILKKIGPSGALWGESGYNTETSESLWPWSYEDIIQRFFKSYGTADNPIPTRGFCAPGATLTKYIWEYLGNPIPSEIYSSSPHRPLYRP